MKFKVSAVLPTPADVYFMERDSSAFRSLVARMSNLQSLEMGKSWTEGEAEVYEFITKPDIERYVPKQFKHFIPGGDLHYMDVITYDPKEISKSPYVMHVTSIPPIFSSKATIKSTLTIEEETPETCRQTLEGSIHIKIVGLGPIAERIVVDNLKTVYKHVPAIVERWVNFRNEIMNNPGGKAVLISGRPQNLGVPWINDRVKQLLKEDIPDLDTSSETSTNYPSLNSEDFEGSWTEDSSIDPSTSQNSEEDSDEDVFFDAREQTSWLDLSDLVAKSHGKDPKLERQLEKDTTVTHQLLSNYQKTGKKLKVVGIEDGKRAEEKSTEKVEGPEESLVSRRFSAQYNTELAEWGKFWEDHEVPQRQHDAHFKARLGNLFRIGADAGMFKKKKGRKHLVPWIHRKHKKSKSQDGGPPSTEFDKKLKLTDVPESDESGHEKGHRRQKSGPFRKGLFTRVTYEEP